jgi:hypothetical protein
MIVADARGFGKTAMLPPCRNVAVRQHVCRFSLRENSAAFAEQKATPSGFCGAMATRSAFSPPVSLP